MEDSETVKQAVLHIIVVGFHHKKGCQVEFSYPPLINGEGSDSSVVPNEWKYLPFLALPDGAHNYIEDTIYFHLPPRQDYMLKTTVYGVSCYRQISAHLLKRKDADVTRETVQKSVVILSQMPIYGLLHAKLQMITEAYFEEKDFAKNEILKELFDHVNLSINRLDESQKHLGLSPRSLVLKFQHKVVMLFKLLLLERKVLFYGSPVHKLVGVIMGLLSLYPEMIDKGLSECTTTYQEHVESVKGLLNLSTELLVEVNDGKSLTQERDILSISGMSLENNKSSTGDDKNSIPTQNNSLTEEYDACTANGNQSENNDVFDKDDKNNVQDSSNATTLVEAVEASENGHSGSNNTGISDAGISDIGGVTKEEFVDNDKVSLDSMSHSVLLSQNKPVEGSTFWGVTSETAINVAATVSSRLGSLSSSIAASFTNQESVDITQWNLIHDIEDEDDNFTASFGNSRLEIRTDSPAKTADDSSVAPNSSGMPVKEQSIIKVMKLDDYKSCLKTDNYGFPLSLFTRGYFCFPYISLQQHGELTDNLDRGYVVGATNILFKTHTHLTDVVVDIDSINLDIRDSNLKRLLHLSAADLRFAEYLVSNVSDKGVDDVFLDATGWEGGDEWIKARFMDYLIAMLAMSTEVNINHKEVHDFNEFFLAAWKQTQNYKVWLAGDHPAMDGAKSSHPFQAHYSVSDVRLRIYHNLQSSDRGKKIEGAMTSANQAVASTGKLMGTALTSAKSSVTSWWSSKMKRDNS